MPHQTSDSLSRRQIGRRRYVMMKKISVLLLSFLMLLGLVSCDVSGPKEDIPSAYPARVANVTIEKTPTKAVCLSPSLLEICFELGFGNRIVGRTTDASYPESAASLPAVGTTGHIDTAALVALKPDTVISHESLSKKEMEAFEAADIKTIILPMAKSLEEMQLFYEQLGLMFVGQLEGKTVGDTHFKAVTDELTAIKTKLPADAFPNGFLYVVNPSGIAATPDTFESDLLSSVFGANAAEGESYSIKTEKLAAKNPSVILIAEPYGLPHLESNNTYKALGAVKSKKVVTVDSTLFSTQSFRITEAVKKAAEALYPDLFQEEEPVSSQAAASSVSNSSK